MKYGPQTPEIEEVLDKLRNMTPEQADRLRSAWDAAPGAAWKAAWDAARDAARVLAQDTARLDALDTARVLARDVILYAARDAITALLVKGEISGEHFEILYGPWGEKMD